MQYNILTINFFVTASDNNHYHSGSSSYFLSVCCSQPPVVSPHPTNFISLKQFGVWRLSDYLASSGAWEDQLTPGEHRLCSDIKIIKTLSSFIYLTVVLGKHSVFEKSSVDENTLFSEKVDIISDDLRLTEMSKNNTFNVTSTTTEDEVFGNSIIKNFMEPQLSVSVDMEHEIDDDEGSDDNIIIINNTSPQYITSTATEIAIENLMMLKRPNSEDGATEKNISDAESEVPSTTTITTDTDTTIPVEECILDKDGRPAVQPCWVVG